MSDTPHPTELKLSKDRKSLQVSFDDGASFTLSAEYLRVESPSAEVKGHTPSERKYIAGKENVGIIAIEPVGTYAVRITFDDLHSTGLYGWDYFYKLGANYDVIWGKYLEGLALSGKKRL